MEAKSETNKQISSFLFILWAGGAALLSYSLVYALRKPFTAATFDGMDFFGMYKPQNKMFHFCKTFCSKITLVNTIQNVI